jgi:tetratricopeptide (TPR) repeat protein
MWRNPLFLGVCLFMATTQVATAATDTSVLRIQEGTAALLRGQYEQAVTAFDRALQDTDLSEGRLASVFSDRGVAKWRMQRHEDALKDFSKSIELSDGSPATFNNRANVYIDLGQYEEAIKDLDKAIALAPGYGAAYNNRGNAHFQLNHFDQALKDYRRAIQLLPANAIPYNGRAQVQELLGRPYSGLRYITRAIALNGKYTAAYRNRALLFQRLERYDDALADYERLIKLEPEDADLYVGRGQVISAQKKPRTAIDDFSQAIELDPENAQAYIGRGAAYLANKQYDEALADFDQAIVLDSALGEAYIQRAETYIALSNFDLAKADLAKALEILPNYAEAYNLQARIYEAAGDPENAIIAYRKALEFDAFIEGPAEALVRLGATQIVPHETLGPNVKGWEIINPAPKRFVATNTEYPEVKVLLEMHGEGQPEILDWTPLSENLRNFGLLRYAAGRLPDGLTEKDRYELVAIIDLRKDIVVSIEPYITEGAEAKWAWSNTGVVVTDPEGVISAHELRAAPKPKPQVQPREADRWFEEDRSYRRRRRPKGLFDWLFNN